MILEFRYRCEPNWPPLAWIAICETGSSAIVVIHGPKVETRAGWFCEAVWDAPFSEGNFDRTDVVFGSGGRVRENCVQFVSSGTTVDRLQFADHKNYAYVSNSLPCLMEIIDKRPDEGFREYSRFFDSIKKGIVSATRDLPIEQGSVRFVYFNNLRWDGRCLQEIPKDVERRSFDRFENYFRFLSEAMERIRGNLRSSDRLWPFDWLGAISAGYDSPACVVRFVDW